MPKVRLKRLKRLVASIVRYCRQNSRSLYQGLSSTSLTKKRATLRTEFAGDSTMGDVTPRSASPVRCASSSKAYTIPRGSPARTTTDPLAGSIEKDSVEKD